MKKRTTALLLILALTTLSVACGDDDTSTPTDTVGGDTTGTDTSGTDTTGTDTSGTDTTLPDTTTNDTTVSDTTTSDTTVSDTTTSDTTVSDTTTSDTTVSDTTSDTTTSTADVFINEFVITPTAQEALELYNAGSAGVSLDGWTLEHTRATGSDTYTLPTSVTITAGGFHSIMMADISGSLVNRGAILTLKDNAGAVVDEVHYGTYNGAPAPIYGWSSARVADGVSSGNDAADFNMDATPTLGAANDAPAVNLGGSDFVINELLVDNSTDAGFVELYNKGNAEVDASGYILVIGGDDYAFAASTTVAAGAFFVIDQGAAGYPEFADTGAAELVYLFDATGVRLQDINFLGATADGSASYILFPDGDVTAFTGDLATIGMASTTNKTKGAANAQ